MATPQRSPILNRPLSPFMHYRKQYTMVLSILHRITGGFMSVGMALLVYWLVAAASGPEQYAAAQDFLKSTIVQIALVAWTFSFFYHFANGIRHLFWDMGLGFELKTARTSGWIVFTAAVILTLACWALLLSRVSGGAL